MPKAPIRVLIADDSPLFADVLSGILQGDAAFEIVGVAEDGYRAVEMATVLRPDIITMDIQMPELDGLAAIERIMADNPTPILVVTADRRLADGELSFEALRRGALDAVSKPMSWNLPADEQQAFRENLRLLAGVPVVRHARWKQSAIGLPAIGARRVRRATCETAAARGWPQIVAIVSSTGGPGALADILCALPGNYPLPIVLVQHLSPGFAPSLVEWLDSVTDLDVQLASAGDAVRPGTVFVAPDDDHLTVASNGVLQLDKCEPLSGHRPSGTRLLESVARSYGQRAAGLVLTGMGKDGAAGLLAMRRAGAITIAQDAQSSVIFGMPKAAIDCGAAQQTLSLLEIPPALQGLAGLTGATGKGDGRG
jgi:two-component system chemotaxis response regulator CheB